MHRLIIIPLESDRLNSVLSYLEFEHGMYVVLRHVSLYAYSAEILPFCIRFSAFSVELVTPVVSMTAACLVDTRADAGLTAGAPTSMRANGA